MKRQRPSISSSHNCDEHPMNQITQNQFTIVEGQFDDASTSSPDIAQLTRNSEPSSKKTRLQGDGNIDTVKKFPRSGEEDSIGLKSRKSEDEVVQPCLVSFEDSSSSSPPNHDAKDLGDTSKTKSRSSHTSSTSRHHLVWRQQQQNREIHHHLPSASNSWDAFVHELGHEDDKINIGSNMLGSNMPPLDTSMPSLPQSQSENNYDDETTQPGLSNATAETEATTEQQQRLERIHPSSITNDDVLMGRGGGTNRHNIHFRQIVSDAQPQYVQASKKGKTQISKSIVARIRSRGGRFLKLNDDDGYYYDVGDKKATSKTSQALREGLSGRMREIVKASGIGGSEVHESKSDDEDD
jgi:hypothetical protein